MNSDPDPDTNPTPETPTPLDEPEFCSVCAYPKAPLEGMSICTCRGLQPFSLSWYPGENKLVPTHPSDSERNLFYRKKEIDALLADLERALAEAKREYQVERQSHLDLKVKLIDLLHAYGTGETEFKDGENITEMVTRIVAERDAATAEIERLKAERQWQPIETAPKDGTEIWAFIPNDEPQQVVIRWETHEGEGWWRYSDETLADITGSSEAPTHWMPLPAARTTQEGQG